MAGYSFLHSRQWRNPAAKEIAQQYCRFFIPGLQETEIGENGRVNWLPFCELHGNNCPSLQ
jgi:hypothetical protein